MLDLYEQMVRVFRARIAYDRKETEIADAAAIYTAATQELMELDRRIRDEGFEEQLTLDEQEVVLRRAADTVGLNYDKSPLLAKYRQVFADKQRKDAPIKWMFN